MFYKLVNKVPVPCDIDGYKDFLSLNDNDRVVAFTKLGDVEISTVFLGIDHSFGGPVPILFETMVFGGPLEGEMRRYATFEEAGIGHDEMWKAVQEAQKCSDKRS